MGPTRRTLTQALAVGAGGLGLGGSATTAPAEATLDQLERAKGLRFGSTLGSLGRISRFHDLPYRALTARECNVLVAENETRWQQLRPDPTLPYDCGSAEKDRQPKRVLPYDDQLRAAIADPLRALPAH
ncbi:MAG: hypothetical protein JF607_06030 [Burkholderiales bacterium]|jgi:GH35 family endo-1,4-beta-xylanase|nr:hypothetical protein [Burkholderiales bacterium]